MVKLKNNKMDKKNTAGIISISGNLVLIKTQNVTALRLPKYRIYDSEEKAEEALPK